MVRVIQKHSPAFAQTLFQIAYEFKTRIASYRFCDTPSRVIKLLASVSVTCATPDNDTATDDNKTDIVYQGRT